MSPAMNAVLREFKRFIGLSKTEGEGTGSSATTCSIQLLLASSQAVNLIGKQGSQVKAIQESSGAFVRVLSGDEVPHYATSDERVVEIQGESLKVLKALEAVIGHLRRFLVDHSIIPLFEKVNVQQKLGLIKQSLVQTASQAGITSDYPLLIKRDSVFLDRDTQLESQKHHSSLGHDPGLSGLRTSALSRASSAIISQLIGIPIPLSYTRLTSRFLVLWHLTLPVILWDYDCRWIVVPATFISAASLFCIEEITQTMQIPLAYAEDIIGIHSAYQEELFSLFKKVEACLMRLLWRLRALHSQVQTAQQLIQDFLAVSKDPVSSSYGKMDTGLRSNSQFGNTSYSSSSLGTQGLGGYGSTGLGVYGSFRFFKRHSSIQVDLSLAFPLKCIPVSD